MLNPSTTDASQNDPTIRQVIKFSRRWGFRALTVHNLFAVRATDPRKLKELPDPVGPENHTQISLMAELAAAYKEPVICAWGNHGGYMDQANTALGWLDHAGLPPRLIHRLGPLTKAKQPRHPLFTAIDTPRERFYDIDP